MEFINSFVPHNYYLYAYLSVSIYYLNRDIYASTCPIFAHAFLRHLAGIPFLY